MQETWNPKTDMTIEMINKDCQENFKNIVRRSMELGINHFETARGYGTSELQYGPILREYPRSDYILQTKVPPREDPAEFRQLVDKSLQTLLLDGEDGYVDLLSVHGINRPEHLEWVTRPGGCRDVLREYQSRGKVRFVGFSTHGMTPLIVQTIETGLFDYVNLHYHFIGSYTASGTGPLGGNLQALQAAQKLDMGVFIISPTDKGGALYQPPVALCKLCEPLTPITFNNLWLWSRPLPIHTLVIGAARPADLDDHLQWMQEDRAGERKQLLAAIEDRLWQRVAQLFGPDFKDTWFEGLPDAYSNSEGLPVGYLFWLWWLVKAWGLYDYALQRYPYLEAGVKSWDDSRPAVENAQTLNSWTPGIAYRPHRETQLRELLVGHPRQEQVVEAIQQLHEWLRDGGCVKRGAPLPAGSEDWVKAYDLQPDKPFPERGN